MEMAAPIVFINSTLASYVSGDLLIVDYGSSIEVTAELKADLTSITFDQIFQMLAQRKNAN